MTTQRGAPANLARSFAGLASCLALPLLVRDSGVQGRQRVQVNGVIFLKGRLQLLLGLEQGGVERAYGFRTAVDALQIGVGQLNSIERVRIGSHGISPWVEAGSTTEPVRMNGSCPSALACAVPGGTGCVLPTEQPRCAFCGGTPHNGCDAPVGRRKCQWPRIWRLLARQSVSA